MNEQNLLTRVVAPYGKRFTQADSYPLASLPVGTCRLRIENNDGTNALTVTLTFSDATTMAIDIKANGVWEGNTRLIKALNKSGASTTFNIYAGAMYAN